ncbi:hypothetical protein ARMSODRAFT_1023983 [Armillaria solidipes]|uniref:Uncharacterized protein n=1 Tax=Armillaria solidipes TaxID=1076256 RepID=A0A2H3BBU5_9AGAR|nr:hypothetical protein ARMSODRAFT_1023983 [Armillaria solidipes]
MSEIPSEYIPSPGKAATTIFIGRPSISSLPTATTRPTPEAYVQPTIVKCHDPVARGLATVAVFFAIGLLIFTTLLVLRLQKLKARLQRWELAGDDREVLFQTPSDLSEHGDEKKALLGGVVEPELAEETQAGSIVSENDRKSELSAEGESSRSLRKV